MKPRKSFLIKTLLSLTVALCLLSVGMFHIFASAAEPLDIDNSSFAPEVEITPDVSVNDGSTPVSKDQHNAKFDVYTHISEKDGKQIATVYSKEQITNIQNSRADGKWMYLTGEEALYLLDDTMKLFQKYDTVIINDLRGAELARYSLWTDYKLAGTMDMLSFRESVSLLVQHHETPLAFQNVLKQPSFTGRKKVI